MQLHFKIGKEPGLHDAVLPSPAGVMKRTGFSLLRLPAGGSARLNSGQREVVLVVLRGGCSLTIEGEKLGDMRGRPSVFAGKPHAAYVPPGMEFQVASLNGAADVAVCAATVEHTGGVPVVVGPSEMTSAWRGAGCWRRHSTIVTVPRMKAQCLTVGETINPPGHWSSVPPHKHDADDYPLESKAEELYYFRTNAAQGYGYAGVYSTDGDLDETARVSDESVLLIPRGYHEVVAAPGYQLYYLFVLAGQNDPVQARFQPEHAWLLNCEAVMERRAGEWA